jgi:hypothetical protein
MATAKTTAEKKPTAAKKATASKPKAEKKVSVKAAPAKTPSQSKATKTNSAERYKMTEVAAYFIAERDSFAGNAVDYWIAAEIQIGKMLKP